MNSISIVVPTLNEQGNIAMLIDRITAIFKSTNIKYEIIFIDDHSSDGTTKTIEQYTTTDPVFCYKKIGPRGKAFSLLEGFEYARYENICMIDADLQYPPEAIIQMYNIMESTMSDVVLTERKHAHTSFIRRLSSKIFNLLFIRLLFGFKYDSQSGLKLFKKRVIETINLTPTPWSFDLEFIVRSLQNNFKIINYKIDFAERFAGEAKVKIIKVTYELAKASLKLRFRTPPRRIKHAYKMNLRFVEKSLITTSILIGTSLSSLLAWKPEKVAASIQIPNAQKLVVTGMTITPEINTFPLPVKNYLTITPFTPKVLNQQPVVLAPSETAAQRSSNQQKVYSATPAITTMIRPIDSNNFLNAYELITAKEPAYLTPVNNVKHAQSDNHNKGLPSHITMPNNVYRTATSHVNVEMLSQVAFAAIGTVSLIACGIKIGAFSSDHTLFVPTRSFPSE
ncbi:MAG: hypothetical protein NVS1B7_4720 [Candidatus Saccharimonadales bacterium]